jgi:hypothetical protein
VVVETGDFGEEYEYEDFDEGREEDEREELEERPGISNLHTDINI